MQMLLKAMTVMGNLLTLLLNKAALPS